jgi:hypothetical protein
LSKKVVISEFLPKIFILNAVYKHDWCLVRRIFLYFHQLVHFPQGEYEGVFPKDLRHRTATRTKFGAHFWRRLIANIDLAQNDPKDPFGATIWQRFGEAIKHLCISIFEIMI